MDRATLRATQAPLKQQYRDDPASAVTPTHARASFSDPGITCTVATWSGEVRAGLHRATGGDGTDACSADMLLQALLACAGVTLRSVATAMGLEIQAAEWTAEAAFDARGTLGVDRHAPIGVGKIHAVARVQTDADDHDLARLARSTEHYCVVAHSLAVPPTITVERMDPTQGWRDRQATGRLSRSKDAGLAIGSRSVAGRPTSTNGSAPAAMASRWTATSAARESTRAGLVRPA